MPNQGFYSMRRLEYDGRQFTDRKKAPLSFRNMLLICLISSICINIIVFCKVLVNTHDEIPTKYAGLSRNVPIPITRYNDYNDPDRKIQDEAWAKPALQVENGVVALEDSFTKAVGLPHAMRWPWDRSKGVYVLSASHEIHCLQIIRDAVNQAHDGVNMTIPHEHVIHCLDYLRQIVMCNANDIPLYSGRLHSQVHEQRPMEGAGQIMMCRDWYKLQAWGLERSACYNSHKEPAASEADKYKFCPNNRQPWKDSISHT